MPTAINVITLIVLVLIMLMHALTVFAPKRQYIFTFINVILHTGLTLSVLYFGKDVDMLVMLFTVSVALYSVLYFIKYKIWEKEDKNDL